jgi:hypothetical protein
MAKAVSGQNHKIGVSISNTHKPTIEWLHAILEEQ